MWLLEEKPYSERTTSSEPSEMEDDEERRELEQEHMQLLMEEEELLAIGQLCCNDTKKDTISDINMISKYYINWLG